MNRQKQMWLVLIFALIELGGDETKANVLEHIQNNQYWYKNDSNDKLLTSRNEYKWRNDFSYERQHLVEYGYMSKKMHGRWILTENGRNHFNSLVNEINEAQDINTIYFTTVLLQKIHFGELFTEEVADQILINSIRHTNSTNPTNSISLVNAPLPKGELSKQNGNQKIYLRAPIVSRNALSRAGHSCEANSEHASFRRKNSSDMYMEPHHLIPMSKTDSFGVNLDREQNIFSLCSNCHNQIHYGAKEDVRNLISTLFNKRKEEICSILLKPITVEEIFEIYDV